MTLGARVLLVIASVQLEYRLIHYICVVILIMEQASENLIAVGHLVVFDD